MTRDELRRRSLLAAASVVLALGTGCDGGTKVDDDDTSAYTADSATTEEDLGPDCNALGPDETTACCEERATWCEETVAIGEDLNECTYGPDYDGSTGCIPWGPAAPPAFRGVA